MPEGHDTVQQHLSQGQRVYTNKHDYKPLMVCGNAAVAPEYFQGSTSPRVMVIITSRYGTLALREGTKHVLPTAEVVWGENFLAGVHRAFITELGFYRRSEIPRGKSRVLWEIVRPGPVMLVETYSLMDDSFSISRSHSWMSIRVPDNNDAPTNELDELIGATLMGYGAPDHEARTPPRDFERVREVRA